MGRCYRSVAADAAPSVQPLRGHVILIQKIRPVQRIPLLRNKSGIPNQPPQLLFARAIMRARGRDHVLFDHDAADIVAAKPQPHLAGFQPRRHPRRLDVQNVLQVQPRNRQRLQIFDTRRLFLDEPPQRRVLALERPWNKRREAARCPLESGARCRSDSCAAQWFRRSRTSSSPWSAAPAHAPSGVHRSNPAWTTSAG